MALYVIGDLHLCLGNPDKSMEIFGGAWTNYIEKMQTAFTCIRPDDTTVLAGDLSWAINLEQAKNDFSFIDTIPGRKIIVKGNHDYWWSTAAKFYKFCQENNFHDQYILNNNCYDYQGIALCGTRGWFFEEDRSGSHDKKVFNRELIRLETSLNEAGDQEKIVFLHYPPIYRGYECTEILALLHKYHVRRCFYGHLHGASHKLAMEGIWDGIEYKLISADRLNFHPYPVIL